MSKPFKSQFDLMAEAYGNVNYSKQRVINEDTAGKTVIGYPPSEDAEDNEHSPVEACMAAIDDIANGDTSAVQTCVDAIDKLSATLQGDEKVAVYEDLRDYIKGSLQGFDVAEDLQKYLRRGLGHSENAEDGEHAEPVAFVSMDTEEVGDCGSEDHADDSEMHMAQAELYKATEYASKLSELLNSIDSLEGWTASKITRASDYLSSVYHWLDYETNGKGRFNTGYEDAAEHSAEDNQ